MIPPLLAYRTRDRIVRHFCAFRAVEAGEAVHFVPQQRGEALQLGWMRDRGIIREAGQGIYWIDLNALAVNREARRKLLVPLVGLSAIVIAWLLTRMFVVVRF
jgi:hypothetical protein